MFMIVQYSYITWSPPKLTEEQILELGKQITLDGREQFTQVRVGKILELAAVQIRNPADEFFQFRRPLFPAQAFVKQLDEKAAVEEMKLILAVFRARQVQACADSRGHCPKTPCAG